MENYNILVSVQTNYNVKVWYKNIKYSSGIELFPNLPHVDEMCFVICNFSSLFPDLSYYETVQLFHGAIQACMW